MSSESVTAVRTRNRKTRKRVRFVDSLSKTIITVGGVGTIFSVVTVCVFLLFVVYPLFQNGYAIDSGSFKSTTFFSNSLVIGTDEHRLLSWDLGSDGRLRVFDINKGEVVATHSLTNSPLMKADHNPFTNTVVVASEDGRIVMAKIIEKITFFEKYSPNVPKDLPLEGEVKIVSWRDEGREFKGIIKKTPTGQYRAKTLQLQNVEECARFSGDVVDLHHVHDAGGEIKITLICENLGKTFSQIIFSQTEIDILNDTEEKIFKVGGTFEFNKNLGPDFIRMTSGGAHVLAFWNNGKWKRLTFENEQWSMQEEGKLFGEKGVKLTDVENILGEETIVVSSSVGGIDTYFLVPKKEGKGGGDGFHFQKAKSIPANEGAVVSLAVSSKSRLIAALKKSGKISVYQMTSQKEIASISSDRVKVKKIALCPKDNSIIGRDKDNFYSWNLEVMHPEANLSTLFTKVHYEGYADAQHMWQSSSGSNESEAKFGLMPLIFGTLKATFYSLIFGGPLALLAALYSSEFLDLSTRKKIKPLIEMMASLPSVVLGFLAALYFAPIVEANLAAVLACILTVPLAFLCGGCVLQFLPTKKKNKLGHFRFPFYLLICLPLGIFIGSYLLSALMENIFFLGDLKAYLHGHHESPTVGHPLGGWMILLFPISLIVSFVFFYRYLDNFMREHFSGFSLKMTALVDLGRLVLTMVVGLTVAFVLSTALSWLGDLRGASSVIDTYVQRNALVVGFIMGFSIIPIIYSIAEDALTAVPNHLRAASYGAGATRWQTAMRIVVPTAMSGLFSACMVGLGRAVGETMIVLMAAGNTPLMEMNIFNGFRTLSANIAVELPEAVQGSTHYRVLFLAALVLFMLTFVLNTGAEIIRLRFRKKTFQL